MTETKMLPLRCVCGYQNKINKLKSDLEIAERRLTELGNNLHHAINENYELRNKLGEEKKTRTAIEHALANALKRIEAQ